MSILKKINCIIDNACFNCYCRLRKTWEGWNIFALSCLAVCFAFTLIISLIFYGADTTETYELLKTGTRLDTYLVPLGIFLIKFVIVLNWVSVVISFIGMLYYWVLICKSYLRFIEERDKRNKNFKTSRQ